MKGAVLYGPRDVRFEERDTPKIVGPTPHTQVAEVLTIASRLDR